MPFPEQGGFISSSLKPTGENILGRVERLGVVGKAIDVSVFTGENRCPGWGADCVGAKRPFEDHALGGKSIQVGSDPETCAVGSGCGCGVVVGVKKENVGLRRRAA